MPKQKKDFSIKKVLLLSASLYIAVMLIIEIINTVFYTGLRDTMLFNACEAGNYTKAKILVKYLFADVNKEFGTTEHTFTLLGVVTSANKGIEFTKLLVDNGADVNYPGVLYWASGTAMGEQLDIVKLLIKHGAKVSSRNYSGYTALDGAARCNYIKTMEFLISKGADVNAISTNGYKITPLLAACSTLHYEAAELLIKHGAEVNVASVGGTTPVYWAAGGNIKLLNLLIANGADINKVNKNKEAPLHYAANNKNNAALVKLLIKHGADVNAADDDGNLPIHNAARKGNTEAVKVLIMNGSKIDIFNTDNYYFTNINKLTPLVLACVYEQHEAVKLLIQAGADVNLTEKKARTPLHWACYNGNIDIVKLLIDNGANALIKDKDGKIAKDIAKAEGYENIVKLLN